MTDPISDIFRKDAERANRRDAARVSTSMSLNTTSPDAMAEAMRIGSEVGVPPSVIAADPDPWRERYRQDRATEVLSSAPKTRKWLDDPVAQAISQGEVERLADIEKAGGKGIAGTMLGRGVQRGVLRARSGIAFSNVGPAADLIADYGKSEQQLIDEALSAISGADDVPEMQAAQIRMRAVEDARARFRQIKDLTPQDVEDTFQRSVDDMLKAQNLREAASDIEFSEAGAAWRDGPLKDAPNSIPGLLGAIGQDPAGFAAFLSETAAEVVPALVTAGAATAVTRSPATGAALMGGSSYLTENAEAALGFLEERGVSVSTPEDALSVLSNSALMTEARKRGVDRGLVIAVFDAMSGGIAGQRLARSVAGDMIAQGVAQMSMAGAGEAIGQMTQGDGIDVKEVGLEMFADLATAPIEVAGVGGRAFIRQRGYKSPVLPLDAPGSGFRAPNTDGPRIRRQPSQLETPAADTAARLNQIDRAVEGVRLKELSPEKFDEFAKTALPGEISVPAEAFREYFQGKEVSFEDALSLYEVSADEFAELEAAGADITIPEAIYASRVSGTDDAAWFKANAVTDADEVSLADIDRFNDSVQDIMQAAYDDAESARLSDLETRASDQQVFDGVYSQLRQAGRSPDVARNEAQLFSAFFRTMADRSGDDALDLARRMGIRFRRAGDAPARRRGDLDIQLNTLRRLGDKALKPTGESLLSFVRGKGGIRDVGGDFEAMGAPKGVIGETAAEVTNRRAQPAAPGLMPTQGRGIEVDEMARAAAEAGYLPGVDPQDAVAEFTEALRGEIAGEPVYIPGEGVDPAMLSLSEELSRAGVELSEMGNDAVVRALENGTVYDQENQGSIRFPVSGVMDNVSVVTLFDGADLSTVIHEGGHFFLEAFNALATSPEASQAMREDLASIREWLGVKDGEAFAREHHEKWALGFEAYAMEGKAPSLALADAFSRFKAWLIRAYQSALGLKVNLTPQVREVMDRMLATDAEISQARAGQSMSPLFKEKPADMSDVDWQTYQRMARRSTEQASQKLLKKVMAKVRREKEAWWKEERAAVEVEVADRINKQPLYRLTEALSNRVWIGRDGEIEDMRLDRDALVSQFGEGVLSEIGRAKLGGNRAIYAKGGNMSPQVAAKFFGFPDAGAMIEALQNAPRRKDAIREETDRVMIERHGDPLADGSIEEEALAAIHSDQQMKTAAAEARQMARQAGRETRSMTSRVYRQRARSMLSRLSVGQAAKPMQFLAAERRAAKKAQEAFARVARGGGEEALRIAAKAKEQQILSGYLYLEAREFAATVAKRRAQVQRYGKKSIRKKLEGGYIEQIDAILSDVDFRKRSGPQIGRAESLRAFVERMVAEGREADLSIDERLLDEASRKNYARMTVDEFLGLFDTIDNLDYIGRFKQKLIDRRNARNIAKVAGNVASQIRKSPASKTRESSLSTKFLNIVSRMNTIMVSLDRGDEMGVIYRAIKAPIDEGQNAQASMEAEMGRRMDDLFRRFYDAKTLRKMQEPRQIVSGRQWAKTDILAIALNTGNEENFQRLMDPNVADDSVLTDSKLKRLLSEMDANDWAFVQAMWDEIDSYWPQLSEVSKRRTGVAPKKVAAKLMVDAPSGVRGGYYPIKYDPTRSAKAAADEKTAWDKAVTSGHGATTQIANGMTKAREKSGGGRTLLFDLSVPMRHMRETIAYITLSEAVDNAGKILKRPEVFDAMIETGNADTLRTIELWLKDLAQGPKYNSDPINSLARIVKNNFTMSRLAFNMKTVILQVTGFGQSAATIGKMNMVRGMLGYYKRPSEAIQDVLARSTFMRERMTTFQKDIRDFMSDAELQGPLASRYRQAKTLTAKAGFAPIVWMQFYVVDMPTWVGAFESGLRQFDGDEVQAEAYADSMVARAQDTGLFAERSAIERGTLSEDTRQSDVVRLFTTLGGYMIAKLNRVRVSTIRAREGVRAGQSNAERVKVALNYSADMFLLLAFEAIVMGYLYALATDEEEPEDVRNLIAKETGMALIGGIPIVRDAASAATGFSGGGIYGAGTETFPRVIQQAMQGENDAAMRRAVLDAVGLMTGLPSTATTRVLEGILRPDEVPPAEMLFGSNPLTR